MPSPIAPAPGRCTAIILTILLLTSGTLTARHQPSIVPPNDKYAAVVAPVAVDRPSGDRSDASPEAPEDQIDFYPVAVPTDESPPESDDLDWTERVLGALLAGSWLLLYKRYAARKRGIALRGS